MMYGACYDPNHSTAITRLTAEVARLKAIIENPTLLQWMPAHLLEAAQAEVARLTRELAYEKTQHEATAKAGLDLEARQRQQADALRAQLEAVTRERDAFNAAGALDPENAAELAAAHDALRACVTQLRTALLRLRADAANLAAGRPVRSFDETLAEVDSALEHSA